MVDYISKDKRNNEKKVKEDKENLHVDDDESGIAADFLACDSTSSPKNVDNQEGDPDKSLSDYGETNSSRTKLLDASDYDCNGVIFKALGAELNLEKRRGLIKLKVKCLNNEVSKLNGKQASDDLLATLEIIDTDFQPPGCNSIIPNYYQRRNTKNPPKRARK